MASGIDAFLVRRDDDGKVKPFEVQVLSMRDEPLTIEIKPCTLGSLKGLEKPNEDAVTWPVEDKLRYIREHVTSPDFSALSVEELMDQMTIWDLDMILIAAVQNGGPMRQRQKKAGPPKRSGQSKKRSRR